MEGCSDKSSSLSVDSGELIDLSALDSDGKTGESSPGKTIRNISFILVRVMVGLGALYRYSFVQ